MRLKESNKYLVLLWKIALISLPFLLVYLPIDFFDNGETVCLSMRVFNLECPGCGMTRAFMHLIHGDVEGAIDYNVFVIIVLPIAFLLWVKEVLFRFFNILILKFL
jgi:hypothetical protein